MHMQLLGPLRLSNDRGDLALSGAVPRGIVGRLLLARGATIGRDALIDGVWGGRQARHPVNALQVQMSKLRTALAALGEGGRLVSAHGGYRLVLEPGDRVDAWLFEDAVREGRSHLAAGAWEPAERRFRDGLALWRGRALDGLDEAVFEAERTRLEELRLSALEDAAAAALERGGAGHLVPDLKALVAAEPLRERSRARLMLALHRSGRHAEALEVYDEGRRLLDAELGAIPSAELRDLHTAMLRDDPSLRAPASGIRPGGAAPAAGGAAPDRDQAPPRTEGNLARPLGPFVGRHGELAALRTLAARERLVTVVGPGGVGKTRLVLEACALLQPSVDAVWWVDLTSVDQAGVLTSLASTLGLLDASVRPDEPPNDYVRRLVSLLSGRRVVLALDNCEHLLDAIAPLVVTLLGGCPALTVLATSREPLAATGEVLHPLAPMPEEEAADLFSARAVMIDPGFATDETSMGQVRALCRRLDGLPLAVELAAAHVRLLPVPEITDRLDDRFSLLTRGGRTAPARHRTLRAVLDWSYALLDASEQRVLRELSLYVGGFSLQETSAARLDGGELLRVLGQLVDKSLLFPVATAQGSRLRMLDTVREYALSRLRESEEAAEAEERFTGWAVALVREGTEAMSSREQTRWARRLTEESANLRSASAVLAEHGRHAESLLLEARLGYYWFFSGREEEGIRRLERSLAAYDAAAADRTSSAAPAPTAEEEWAVFYTFAWLGWLNHVAGRHADAASYLSRHEAAWRGARNPDLAVLGPCYDTLHAMLNGRQDLAGLFETAESKVVGTASHWDRAVLQTNWSTYCLQHGDVAGARLHGRIAVAASQAAEDDFARAFSLTLCGDADESDGLRERAREQWTEAARILRPMGARPRWAYAMLRLVCLDIAEGGAEAADDRLTEVAAVADELSSEDLRAAVGNLRAVLAAARRDAEAAHRAFRSVWDDPAAPLDRRAVAALGMAALAADPGAARDWLDRVREAHERLMEPLARRAVGVLLAELGARTSRCEAATTRWLPERLAATPSALAAFC
ncbi:BTAD domain-containing putative transcriptional regulator [Streptomyces lichenis]|uniref:NB-ARC domain-containing protein n=1 Tax=Streptomyces lichenis TaxID=2306967 RepID=A0ABT0IA42_9ACTN|nr:BTAD domain-containing putative transcriptional regulator [Streptomyces lichenis]MCK8678206.1 NB-ARC domain-containing protein [Streptomyces lichenis]